MAAHVDFYIPSWTCGLCETENRWPTKQQAMDHIRESHLESLVRATLKRSGKEPTETLPDHGAPEADDRAEITEKQ